METVNGMHQTPVMVTEQPLLDQVLEQSQYDARVIDKVLMRGDLKAVEAAERLEFYRAVCLSVGLSPLTQPFILMERQDKTLWIYATATATQQLAKLHRVSFTEPRRVHETIHGDPIYRVELVASTPDGRRVPAQAVVSLTKKKRVQKGAWPDGNPKFIDALDEDGEPLLIPLRGEALANALMRADTKAQRRGTLALLGLGWIQTDYEGRQVQLNMQTGELLEEVVRETVQRPLTQRPAEQGKTGADHASDLFGDQAGTQATLAAARQGATPPAVEVIEDQPARAAMQQHIYAMHVAHGYGAPWIAAYWRKMEARFGATPGGLTDAQIAECEQVVANYYERLDTQGAGAPPIEDAPATHEDTPNFNDGPKGDPKDADTLDPAEGLPGRRDTAAWRTLKTHVDNPAVAQELREQAQDLLLRTEDVPESDVLACASNILNALEGRYQAPEAQGELV